MTESWLKENIWPRFSRVLQRQEIYLANHSLGRPPDKAFEDVSIAMAHWYQDMDSAWDSWIQEVNWFRASVCQLINASAAVPKSSAGQGLRAVLNAFELPINVVSTTAEFDSIDFILRTYESKGKANVRWVEPSQLVSAITDDTDLVVFSLVLFRTGEIIGNAEEIITKAHSVGAKVLVDVYHAVGVIPVDMHQLGAEFMIGGSYKYARGGPGACWLAYTETGLETLDTGWFAKKEPFAFERTNSVERGDAWLESTPAVLPIYQARAGLELIQELGVPALREYSLEQQAALREALRSNGVPCQEPADPYRFGAFSLVPSSDPHGFVSSLKSAGVNVDARGKFVRFCPDILNSEDELRETAQIVGGVLRT